MATVYKRVKGRKIEKHLALMPGVQKSLDKHLKVAAAKARAELALHRDEGHAEIQTARGRIDRYLFLSDERGLKAAMTIEYGRKAKEGRGGMVGLFILHRAFDIPRGGD